MTAYVASWYYSHSGSSFQSALGMIVTGAFPARIVRVEFYASNGPSELDIGHYAGASFSGSGTTFSPLALRPGAPASTVTVKGNTLMSGTQTTLIATTAANTTSTGTSSIAVPGSTSYDFPFDYILKVGNGIWLNNAFTPPNSYVLITLYWDEIRLLTAF